MRTESGSRTGAPGDVSFAKLSHSARRAVAFSYYGLASLGLAFVGLPLDRWIGAAVGRTEAPDLRAQWLIHRTARSCVRVMELLGLARIRWCGAQALVGRPVLVVANHPSLIDTTLLISHMPQADFIVKPEWGNNPFLRGAASAAGYLRADRGAQVVDDAVARLRAGRSVVIYPEGSRTPREGLRRFHRGAAHIALEAACDLLPVLIQVTPRTLMKDQRWTETPERTPEWRIEVGEPIRPAEHLDGGESRPLAARRLTAVLRDYFDKRWDSAQL